MEPGPQSFSLKCLIWTHLVTSGAGSTNVCLYVLQRAHINSACHWNSELQANSVALCLLVLSCLIGLELGLWSRQPLPPIWDY